MKKTKLFAVSRFLFITIFTVFSACFLVGCAQVTDKNSRAHQCQYLQDLEFIHEKIIANHPGVYNDLDPDFNSNLEKFYQEAKAKIMATKSPATQKQAINEFTKSFKDYHLGVFWNDMQTHRKKRVVNTSFKIFYPAKDIAWITLPTFDLKAKQLKDFEKLVETMPTLQNFKHIIFDLRGNGGGNSAYGSQLVAALFGKEYVTQQFSIAYSKTYVDWRMSEDNVNHIKELAAKHQNLTPENYKTLHDIETSLQKGEKYYRKYFTHPDAASNATSKTTVSINVIIDHFVGSAALDFVDYIKFVAPGAILVGEQTSADRLYMELNFLSLPSANGRFFYPLKVYRNRPRGDNEPYKPDIEFKDVSNTKALKKFVLAHLTKD